MFGQSTRDMVLCPSCGYGRWDQNKKKGIRRTRAFLLRAADRKVIEVGENRGRKAQTGFPHKNSIAGRFKFCLPRCGPFTRRAVETFVIQSRLGEARNLQRKRATRKKQIARDRDGTFAKKRDKIANGK